jgi:AcrR family transcriptional regulator
VAERRLTKRGQERRDKLLAFATAEFARKGFHATSVSDIVDGVGVGKGVFYWYFDSKDELLIEVLRESLRDLRATQATAIADATDPLQRLEAGIRASLIWSSQNSDIMKLVTAARSEEPFSRVLRRGREILIADSARLIEQAIDLGQIMTGNPVIMALSVRAVIDTVSNEYAWHSGADEGGDEAITSEVVETAVRMCLRGLRG